MSDNATQEIDELSDLEATDSPDNGTDRASTTDSLESTNQGGGEESQDLELEASEVERQKQVNTWLERVKLGKVTLDEVKAKVPWAAKEVAKLLSEEEATKAKQTEAEILKKAEERAKQILEEERVKDRFKKLKGDINDYGLTSEQLAKVKEKFAKLNGPLDPYEALKTAVEAAGVDLDKHERQRRAMQVPEVNARTKYTDPEEEIVMDQANRSDAELMELAKKRFGK